MAAGVVYAGDSTGPDVTVFEIADSSGFGEGLEEYSQSGDTISYAMMTQSCNRGNEPLDWYDSNDDHPVIAQNMYRLKDGRFEHIGLSWLKHGFAALNETDCGPCQSTGFDTLGVDCADTYSAGLNSSGLGPRSDINASTGESTVNPSFPADNTHDGRVVVYVDDIDPDVNGNSDAEYFVEGH